MFEKFFHYKEILGWISGFPVITEPPIAHCFELNYRLLKKAFKTQTSYLDFLKATCMSATDVSARFLKL